MFGYFKLNCENVLYYGTEGVEFTQIIPVKLGTPLLKLMFIMLTEEVCMLVSNACRLHTWHHDVMLSHFLLYSVTELSRRWCHFILVELHKIFLKEEERSGMAQFFRKKLCMPSWHQPMLLYLFLQIGG